MKRVQIFYWLGTVSAAWALGLLIGRRKRQRRVAEGVAQLIGHTDMVKIESLSRLTGCTILAKCEYSNPGGSIKDRVALEIVCQAERDGKLCVGDTIYEGTAGSTGVSLAMIAASRGYRCTVFLPDDQSAEKTALLRAYGATVAQCRPLSIVHSAHCVNKARTAAAQHHAEWKAGRSNSKGFFADQFENLANQSAHYKTTGPEIWEQTSGLVDAFVCAAGTGGTISGVSQYLKEKRPDCKVYLIDPPGSGLYNKINHGVLYAAQDAEGCRLRHSFDTVTEGIGINRTTRNMQTAVIDKAFRGTDEEAVAMSRLLVLEEGLLVGSSSAMNCVGAVKAARELGPGHVIVTLLCDSGQRHLSKFFNDEYLAGVGLSVQPITHDLSFVA